MVLLVHHIARAQTEASSRRASREVPERGPPLICGCSCANLSGMSRIRRMLWGRAAVGLVVVAVALVVAVPGSAMPTTGADFLAMGTTSTSSIITGSPPDPNGAVGP